MATTSTLVPAPTTYKATPGMLAKPLGYTAPVANATNVANPTVANATLTQQNQQMGTVEGRTASILDANSPLMQRARARANEASNARGLVNSSMAVGAGQNAVIDQATRIAAPDAASYNQFQRDNQQAQNSMEQFNVGNQQQVNMADAQAANRMEAINKAADAQAQQFTAQQANAFNSKQASLDQQTNLFNTQQQNKVIFDQLDQNNKIAVMNIEAQYKNEMQANVTASKLFSDTMSALSIIQKDTTMNAATKQRNIDQMISMLKTGMNMAGTISNLNLGAVLDFSGLPASV